MQPSWKKSVLKVTVWIAAEIVLNLIGIDDLADYSEFIFESRHITADLPATVIYL